MNFSPMIFFMMVSMAVAQTPTACFENAHVKVRRLFQISPLQTYETPMNITSHAEFRGKCGNEWATYGVCCNPWSTSSHVLNNDDTIVTAATLFVAFFKRLHGQSENLFTVLKKLALADTNNNHAEWNTNIQYARDFLNKGDNLLRFEQFAKVGDPAVAAAYETDMQKCWTNMVVLRKSSICAICSGRSAVFFKAGKGLVNDTTCKKSITNCLGALKTTFNMIRMLRWLWSIYEELKSRSIRVKVDEYTNREKFEKTYSEINTCPLLKNIDSLSTQDVTSDTTKSRQICEKYFNLAKLPFIHLFRYDLRPESVVTSVDTYPPTQSPIDASITKIMEKMPAFETQLANLLKEYKTVNNYTEPRALQLLTPTTMLESDVSFIGFDNLYSSSVDEPLAIGSTPMNLSLVFP